MASSPKKPNDFKDKSKVAVITAVDPQKKTIDIKYLSQAGEFKAINLNYTITGLTWGLHYMPVKGDKVIIDNAEGDRPVIKSMHPQNVDYLPYLDPGEISLMCENGSYIHGKCKRKRVKSTNELIDYDAQQGPNGEKDIQYEPGGITIRARSKKNRDGQVPRWDNHSFLSLFDNGDVTLQSTFQDIPKGLMFMCGESGMVFLKAGNGSLQEYIEMNPLKKEMVFLTDGEEHHHVQTNLKTNIYKSAVYNIGKGLQIVLGQSLATIPSDFDQVQDNLVNQGDIYISNSGTQGSGKATLHVKGDFDITLDQGDINIITTQGKLNLNIKGDVDLTTQGNLNAQVQGNSNVETQGNTTIASDGVVNLSGSAVTMSSTGGDVTWNGDGPIYVNSNSDIYLGNGARQNVLLSDFFNGHYHVDGPPGRTGPPGQSAPDTQIKGA